MSATIRLFFLESMCTNTKQSMAHASLLPYNSPSVSSPISAHLSHFVKTKNSHLVWLPIKWLDMGFVRSRRKTNQPTNEYTAVLPVASAKGPRMETQC